MNNKKLRIKFAFASETSHQTYRIPHFKMKSLKAWKKVVNVPFWTQKNLREIISLSSVFM